jgi:hypothetical protein
MTRPSERGVNHSTRVQNPMPDMKNEGLVLENSVLYRRVIALEVQNIKFAICLELATGTPWDNVDLSKIDNASFQEMIAQNMARGLNISIDTARDRVREHIALANPSQIETPFQG